MLEIATRAQVSKRDLYALFRNKQAVLADCIKERAQRLRGPLDEADQAPKNREALAGLEEDGCSYCSKSSMRHPSFPSKAESRRIHDPCTIKCRGENEQSPSAFNDVKATVPASEIGVTPPFVKNCTLRPEFTRGIGVYPGRLDLRWNEGSKWSTI